MKFKVQILFFTIAFSVSGFSQSDTIPFGDERILFDPSSKDKVKLNVTRKRNYLQTTTT
jgi:hypothetical protein